MDWALKPGAKISSLRHFAPVTESWWALWQFDCINIPMGLACYLLSSFKTIRFGVRNELVSALWSLSHLRVSALDPHLTHSLLWNMEHSRLPFWVLTAFPDLKPSCQFPVRKAHVSHGEDCWMSGKNLLHWEDNKKNFWSNMSASVSNFNIYTCIGDKRRYINILIYTAKVTEEKKMQVWKRWARLGEHAYKASPRQDSGSQATPAHTTALSSDA